MSTATPKGYLRVTVGIGDHKTVMVQAHRLIWTMLMGPIPDGLQINHKDLNPANNHPNNLELVTGRENIQHAVAHGRTPAYAHAKTWRGRQKLTREQIDEIRRKRAAGAKLKDLGQEYDRHWGYIAHLCRGA